jgi:hypothetical protein
MGRFSQNTVLPALYDPDVFPANPFFNNQFRPSIRNPPVLAASSSPIVASQQRQGKKRRVDVMQDDDEDIPVASGSQHQVTISYSDSRQLTNPLLRFNILAGSLR